MNARPPSPAARIAESLSRFPPAIVALTKKCLPKLGRALPGTTQLVYDYSHSLVVAFGMSERGHEAIVALAAGPREVRLYVDKSTPDPKGLLEGTGRKVRSVVLEAASDLDRAEIEALIRGAIELSGVTLPKGRPNRIVIKSAAKKKKQKPRPKRTRRA